MKPYQRDFIRFALDVGVLKFGSFTLKSGRQSPYFFNAGLFNDGAALAKLGYFYAAAYADEPVPCDVLMGPAYKGIPLVSALAVQLFEHFQINKPWCFNRKEAKDHGEGGTIVGAPLQGKVFIIDDVITAGTAIREVINLIKSVGAEPSGVLIALDRQERGMGTISALQEVEQNFGIKVASIVSMTDLMDFMAEEGVGAEHRDAMLQYRKSYGI